MKRNKPMIALAALLCALLFCPLFAAKADAAGEVNADEYVYDLYENLGRTPMLSASEKQEIAEAMASAVTHRAEGDCRFVFFIYPYEYRNDYLTSTDLYTFSDLVDKPKNVMVLEVTVMPKGYGDRYKFMAHIFGENERVSDTEIEYLEDLIRDDVKAGRFAKGAALFVEKGEQAFYGRLVNKSKAAFASIGIALLLSGALGGGIVYSYKRKQRSASYPLDRFARLELTDRQDVFERKAVTRVLRSNDSGGSGGGGGRSGGGGHSSGSRR